MSTMLDEIQRTSKATNDVFSCIQLVCVRYPEEDMVGHELIIKHVPLNYLISPPVN
jgi:hypothetical protein